MTTSLVKPENELKTMDKEPEAESGVMRNSDEIWKLLVRVVSMVHIATSADEDEVVDVALAAVATDVVGVGVTVPNTSQWVLINE